MLKKDGLRKKVCIAPITLLLFSCTSTGIGNRDNVKRDSLWKVSIRPIYYAKTSPLV
jgi:hypothetical protein